jgi:hypothetical protein
VAEKGKDVPIQAQLDLDEKHGWLPRRFVHGSTCVEIRDVLNSWPQVEKDGLYPTTYCFEVRGTDGRRYLLKHELSSDTWHSEAGARE